MIPLGITLCYSVPLEGQPSTLEETVLVLLSAGFTPRNNPILATKLRQVLKRVVESYVRRYRIIVPMSCGAFIVPGILLALYSRLVNSSTL